MTDHPELPGAPATRSEGTCEDSPGNAFASEPVTDSAPSAATPVATPSHRSFTVVGAVHTSRRFERPSPSRWNVALG